MRHPVMLPVLLALAASNAAFLPGLGRSGEFVVQTELSRRAITVGEPSLLEALSGGQGELLPLLLRHGPR